MKKLVPAFFILTPTHDRVNRLEKAIDSVRRQSHTDWQHFILDDGSADETPRLLANYESDGRIHSWRFDTNQGVNRARNFLLERIMASEKPGFVVILDDDDSLEKDALANFSRAAMDNPSEKWFIANCVLPDGERVSQIRGPYRPLCYVRDHKLGRELSGDVAHVFHTSIIGDDRFNESFMNAEEWWFYAGLAARAKMFAIDMHAKTVEYLEDGLTLRQPNKGCDAEVYARKLERFDRFLNRRQRASLEARLGCHLFLGGQQREGLLELVSAFRHWPFEHRIYTYGLRFLLSPFMRQNRAMATNAKR